MSGLMGRVFREFAITIVVAIFASGIVSLTLTPLMCARMLKDRGHGAKQTWMERVVGSAENGYSRPTEGRCGGSCEDGGSPCLSGASALSVRSGSLCWCPKHSFPLATAASSGRHDRPGRIIA